MSGPSNQTGFSLLEVMITLVILAFGLLGLGMMQTMNLRYTKSAEQRTQAVNLASELLDTIRANRSEADAYLMDEASFSTVTVPTEGCQAYNILTSGNNRNRWRCEVRESLGSDAKAKVEKTADGNIAVTVTWNDEWWQAVATNGSGKVALESKL